MGDGSEATKRHGLEASIRSRKARTRSARVADAKRAIQYRNSIKESVSAVESLVGIALGKQGTLGQLIKKLKQEIDFHPALEAAFSSLYGYTSDADGIRHAILESKALSFEDAKFFLVVCSAFVNFVTAKIVNVGRANPRKS
jgi:hypothetical protein